MLRLSGTTALRLGVRGVASTANGTVKTSTVGKLGDADFRMEYSDSAGPVRTNALPTRHGLTSALSAQAQHEHG